MSNRLIIQLARLGDLLQSLPVIASLQNSYPDDQLDLLCSAPLVSLGTFFPFVQQVLPWDGDEWGHIAGSWTIKGENHALSYAQDCLKKHQTTSYSMAYNLNNHSRAILSAHLLAIEVTGAGCYGPLSPVLPNWVKYLNLVGKNRRNNRVHLADALCGVSGVRPPNIVPTLHIRALGWPTGLSEFFSGHGVRVALIIGSGDADRRIPIGIWEQWICTFLSACPEGRVMLVGGVGECELTYSLLDRIPSLYMGRIWDGCGQTSLPQLANILSQCTWVVGSDTGPLHLGVACGAKAQGFYFSRARVHETGPYGHGHWVWQAERPVKQERVTSNISEQEANQILREGIRPESWPIRESVELLLTETCSVIPEGWSLWSSQQDAWGAHFIQHADPNVEHDGYREQIWEKLHTDENVDWDAIQELMSVSVSSHASQS